MGDEGFEHGTFCWVDLMTTDVAGAKAFYGELLGWTFVDVPTPMGPVYSMCQVGGETAAGMWPQSPDMLGMPPVWTSYVYVDDAEAVAAKAKELGGQVLMAPMKVMEQGTMAMIQDPTGAVFGVWEPGAHRGAEHYNGVGGFCWNELYTPDPSAATEFYQGLFGWSVETSAMGEGSYHSIRNGERPNGGMLEMTPQMGEMPPNWSTYFTVASLDESLAQVGALGGEVVTSTMSAPGVGRFAVVSDPQGGHLLLIELDAQG